MIRWEYTTTPMYSIDRQHGKVSMINLLGSEGWEMITIDYEYQQAYFKRPIAEGE